MRHAVFTIVQDEPFFFPLWYKYYRDHYEPGHIYVLHHALPEEKGKVPEWLQGPVSGSGGNVVQVNRDLAFDHHWLLVQVKRFAEFLCGSYDTVTFTEVDEIIAIDPDVLPGVTLPEWIDFWCRRSKEPAARCTGYEVIHRYDQEPPYQSQPYQEPTYDPNRKLLQDRRWWYRSDAYSKTLIWRKSPGWHGGFHKAYIPDPVHPGEIMGYDPYPEPGLLLIHLHRFDYGVAAARLARTAARFKGAERGGYQNRFTDENQLRSWWYCNVDLAPVWAERYEPATLTEIPERIKDII